MSKEVDRYQTFAICGHPGLRFQPDDKGAPFLVSTHLLSSHSFLKLAHLDLFLRKFFKKHTHNQSEEFKMMKSRFHTYNRFKQYYLASPGNRGRIETQLFQYFEMSFYNMASRHSHYLSCWQEYVRSHDILFSHQHHSQFVICKLH